MAGRSSDTVVVPFVAGAADLELLRTVSPFLAPSLEDHLAAVEDGSRILVEREVRVDLVPVWAPLFLVWCAEVGVDPGSADALERWTRRQAIISVAYTHYEGGPIGGLVELEEVRSWALRSILTDERRATERAVASVWAAASDFLQVVAANAAPGSELDVAVPTWSTPAHWHLDGSWCEESLPTQGHLHAAVMEGLAIDGSAVLVEPREPWAAEVRVWDLSPTGVVPLSAGEAGERCEPRHGATLVDAWSSSARR